MKKSKLLNTLTTFLFYLSVLFFFIGFNFQDSRTGGWIQQFFNPGTPAIQDITFCDSLTGYAITNLTGTTDTNYILKTSNGGFNWYVIKSVIGPNNRFEKLFFLNKDTGCVTSYIGPTGGITNLQKTTNGGLTWIGYSWPTSAEPSDLFVLNTDTIWMCSPSNYQGGLYRTTNSGLNWDLQYNVTSGNPNKIYFYNAKIGFISAGGYIYKTTNSGVSWTGITGQEEFSDMYFIDSLKGYYTNYSTSGKFYKTTNGGNNWIHIPLPIVPGFIYTGNGIVKFSIISDTIYGVGCNVEFPNYSFRAFVYKTTNGGAKWGYQLIDTSWRINKFYFTKFINANTGWCYKPPGIYTNSGGDTTILLKTNENISRIPEEFVLYQNYPNPFNSMTNVKFQMLNKGFAEIKVFDISGKKINTLINENKSSGTYEVKFDGNNLSSGLYFYTLFVDGVRGDTKKAILLK